MNSICPVCGSNDAVQHIDTVITNGSSRSVSIGGAFGITGSASGSTGLLVSSSASNSNLVRRFFPPQSSPDDPKIGRIIAEILLGPILTVFVVGAANNWVTLTDWIVYGVLVWMAAVLPWLIFAMLDLWISPVFARRKKAIWNRRCNAITNGYYCFRDDIAFNDLCWGKPESYAYTSFVNG